MQTGSLPSEPQGKYICIIVFLWLSWAFIAVRRLLIVVASLVVEHRALGTRASVVAAWRL